MNNELFIPEKLKKARVLLRLSQSELAEAVAMQQKDISLHENKSTKTLIPVRYLLFLYSKGIDINTLFDATTEVRLRPPSIPAVEQILEANRHIQALAGPPEWLKEVLAGQERIKQELKAELLKELQEAAQKRATPPKNRKTG